MRASVLVLAALPLLAGAPLAARQRPVELRPGMVITRSIRVAPKEYRLPAKASMDSAAIVIRGNDITVDFGGATMRGTAPGADPDQGTGVAIRVEGGRNVQLRNLRLRGYKIGILVRGTRNLTLERIDASDNWKPRLYSLIEHESLVDWLSYHQNEKDEWQRHGAGFYLTDVRGGTIRNNTVLRGMNGLLITRSDSLRIVENNFSFNSGLGVGLYRSSFNSILRNRLDYNVRGYSHGFYRRGQDSAALLMYEQSSSNVVAYNSATHSGDGLFVWAGQSTMDTGKGGVNDNLFFGNDFSYAPTNAMEATFSRNRFIANYANGSDHGLWGGYSYESTIAANCFQGNRIGIAIEHGQDNLIGVNRFYGDSLALYLWANPIEPSDWGYPKHRDTKSRDYRIEGNEFAGYKVLRQIVNTTGLVEARNDSAGAAPGPCVVPKLPPDLARLAPPGVGGSTAIPSSDLAKRPRSAIVVDEWGPYDWRSPKLWPVDSSRAVPLRLAVLGPAGRWRTVTRLGIEALSKTSGRMGDTVVVTPRANARGDWELELEWAGAAGTAPVRFRYGRYEPLEAWTAKFYAWSDSTDIRKLPGGVRDLPATQMLFERPLSRLDYQWYRPQVAGLPRDRWALEAETRVTLPAGEYTLRTISDDGIRVWVDGVLAIDNWDLHGSELDFVRLSAGTHRIRVEFFQVDGWTELRVEVLKGSR